MRRFQDGKIKRSREEWEAIFERFRASGESGAAFCRKHKIPKSSFENWKKKMGPQRRIAFRKPTFVEVPVPAEPKSRPTIFDSNPPMSELELLLPGGVTLRWKS